MATTTRKTKDIIKTEYREFDVLKLFDLIHLQKKKPNVLGDINGTENEPIVCHQNLTLSIQNSCITRLEETENQQISMFVNFLNILGLYGPLPDIYSELILDQKRINHNTKIPEFLDIFTHRLISIFYQSYRRGQVHSGSTKIKDNYISTILYHLSGLVFFEKENTEENIYDFDVQKLLPLFNLFWSNTKSSTNFQTLINSYFNCPVKIKQSQGDWIYPDKSDLSYLGKKFTVLGRNLILGHRMFDPSVYIELTLGPLNWEEYMSFLPPLNQNFETLKQLCHYYLGPETKVRIFLELLPHCSSPLCLGKQTFLGFNTWLTTNTEAVKSYKVEIPLN